MSCENRGNGNASIKRKMDDTDDDVIPGTPQEKPSKKKQRNRKCIEGTGGRDLSEQVMVNDPVINNDFHDQHVDDLLMGIDFLDDFNVDNVQVSIQ